ncbi:MAG TPA: PKD domain-containing protein [Panacibacter sp.]|nr:PKD domain-containing protein [Panacibacter sp.]
MDKRILIFIVVIFLIVAGIITYKKLSGNANDITALTFTVSPHEAKVGDEIKFDDNTVGAKRWEWDFGDDEGASIKNGTHKYKTAGSYTITLRVNDILVDSSTKIMIAESDYVEDPLAGSKKFVIEGPATGIVGKTVTFTDKTLGFNHSLTKWKSGETGIVDGKGATFSYAFTTPGTKTVIATNDSSKLQGTWDITIKRPDISAPPNGGGGGGGGKTVVHAVIQNAQLKEKLQAIADGKFESVYPTLKPYLEQEELPITVNGRPDNFLSYCQSFSFTPKDIVSVDQKRDPKSLRIISMSIIDQKKK